MRLLLKLFVKWKKLLALQDNMYVKSTLDQPRVLFQCFIQKINYALTAF